MKILIGILLILISVLCLFSAFLPHLLFSFINGQMNNLTFFLLIVLSGLSFLGGLSFLLLSLFERLVESWNEDCAEDEETEYEENEASAIID